MRAVFADAGPALAEVLNRLHRTSDLPVAVNTGPTVRPEDLPRLLDGAQIALIDHTALPDEIARQCESPRHVVFLGTGARSYMDPEALAALGITVHTSGGYGDTAVAECASGLLWTAAKGFARMDRGMRQGQWLRSEGVQLTGKTLGLIGYGGIAAGLARLAYGAGMQVLAWNRSPKTDERVRFSGLDEFLAQSDAVSMHLLLNDGTRGFLSAARIGQMKRGAILINTRAARSSTKAP